MDSKFRVTVPTFYVLYKCFYETEYNISQVGNRFNLHKFISSLQTRILWNKIIIYYSWKVAMTQ